jgi:DNA primase
MKLPHDASQGFSGGPALMARIPEAEIDRLKAEVAIERLAEGRGVVLRRHGADLIGLCPFHDDREPSLVIARRRTCGTAWGRARRAGR